MEASKRLVENGEVHVLATGVPNNNLNEGNSIYYIISYIRFLCSKVTEPVEHLRRKTTGNSNHTTIKKMGDIETVKNMYELFATKDNNVIRQIFDENIKRNQMKGFPGGGQSSTNISLLRSYRNYKVYESSFR